MEKTIKSIEVCKNNVSKPRPLFGCSTSRRKNIYHADCFLRKALVELDKEIFPNEVDEHVPFNEWVAISNKRVQQENFDYYDYVQEVAELVCRKVKQACSINKVGDSDD